MNRTCGVGRVSERDGEAVDGGAVAPPGKAFWFLGKGMRTEREREWRRVQAGGGRVSEGVFSDDIKYMPSFV